MKMPIRAAALAAVPLLAVADEPTPVGLPYAQYIDYCASTEERAIACGAYYQQLFADFESQESAGRLACARRFDSLRYIKVYTDYLEAGRGAALKTAEFVAAVYNETRGCTHQ